MRICVAYIDGGSRGNPGMAGYGVLILDEQGKQLAGLSENCLGPPNVWWPGKAESKALPIRTATQHSTRLATLPYPLLKQHQFYHSVDR